MVSALRSLRRDPACSSEMMQFAIKRHPDGLLAIADIQLIDKIFDDREHSITVSRDFYLEEVVDSATAIELARAAKAVNAFGPAICAALVEARLVRQSDVRKVCGIPHVQIYVV